ncbi:hypothetical protein MRB53_040546 [Persea americana]|nr:hypothetical protein MRB53_040546 [Persea americana]
MAVRSCDRDTSGANCLPRSNHLELINQPEYEHASTRAALSSMTPPSPPLSSLRKRISTRRSPNLFSLQRNNLHRYLGTMKLIILLVTMCGVASSLPLGLPHAGLCHEQCTAQVRLTGIASDNGIVTAAQPIKRCYPKATKFQRDCA